MSLQFGILVAVGLFGEDSFFESTWLNEVFDALVLVDIDPLPGEECPQYACIDEAFPS